MDYRVDSRSRAPGPDCFEGVRTYDFRDDIVAPLSGTAVEAALRLTGGEEIVLRDRGGKPVGCSEKDEEMPLRGSLPTCH